MANVSNPMTDTQDEWRLDKYDYDLPAERIAQYPSKMPGESRLLAMLKEARGKGQFHLSDSAFRDLAAFLPDNALIVANNVKVLPCRIEMTGSGGGRNEFLLLSPLPQLLAESSGDTCYKTARAECLLRPARHFRTGKSYALCPGLRMKPLEKLEFGRHIVELRWEGELEKIFAGYGKMPLPPYIRRDTEIQDKLRYQTCYASLPGAMAAPTAGLHFTPELRKQLTGLGHEWHEITLYTGYGTFSPVRSEDIRQHKMHSELMEISETAANAVNKALESKQPVIAIGTTSLRALESGVNEKGRIIPEKKWTDIYIYPGHRFKVVNGLVTNFHLPKSSLLILVSAFAGRDAILSAYHHAIAQKYNFFSYGDAMYIGPQKA